MISPLLFVGLAFAAEPFLEQNCVGCHNGRTSAGGINVDGPLDRDKWERIARRVRAGEMPPKNALQPSPMARAAFLREVEERFAQQDRTQPVDPGRVTMRRLNRFEYANSVRDLLGIDMKAGDDFPPDPYGYGFDNNGDVLSLSPALAEKYLKSAERVARAAIPIDGEAPRPTMERYLAERMGQDEQLHLTIDHAFPVDGEYTLRTAWYQALKDGTRVRLRLLLDGREVANQVLSFYYQIDRGIEAPGLRITAGRHRVEADIEVLPEPKYKGNPPYLEYVQIYGPMKATPAADTETYRRFFVCGHAPGKHDAACARKVLEPVARRAWRRPVKAAEMDGLLSLTPDAPFEQRMRTGLQAILVSPHFLFRAERSSGRLSSQELASRLSYFLWSSLPDAELAALADGDKLRDPAVLRAQTRRMLASPKARALVESFTGQWLQTRNLSVLKPDHKLFPEFDSDLRDAMRMETELFFEAVLKEDRNVLDFLDAPLTFLNERLARHYGIAGVTGPEFRRVALDGAQRSGVLTHASVLTVSSYPTRTSPVIRGKWILENILNAPPPPPPPNVPGLDEQKDKLRGSLRQQLEQHRSNAVCASCHSRMDPLGFGFENYDAVGKWRDKDGEYPVDAAGQLPGGRKFANPAELKSILKADAEAFTEGLVEKMLTFALGRGAESRDRATIRQIAARARAAGYRISEIIHGVVESPGFLMRRPEGQEVGWKQ